MPSYQEVLQKGEKVDEWERGEIYKYEDKYYYLDHKREKIVMKGDFI